MSGQAKSTAQPNETPATGGRASMATPRQSVSSQKQIQDRRPSGSRRCSGSRRFSTIDTLAMMDKSADTAYKRPPLVYLPTYQLGPLRRFNPEKTAKIVKYVVTTLFADHIYSPASSASLAIKIAGKAVREVKQLQFDRYRIFACCTIGQKKGQSYYNAVSFLWDPETDGYVDVNMDGISAFCQLTLFGVYLD